MKISLVGRVKMKISYYDKSKRTFVEKELIISKPMSNLLHREIGNNIKVQFISSSNVTKLLSGAAESLCRSRCLPG